VLAYLARYTHRVAVANSRLISVDATGVTFKWKDYRIEGPGQTMTLSTHEFIRRFLIHVLPKGLHRIRHYAPPISLALANCSPCRKAQRSLISIPTPNLISPALCQTHAHAAVAA
jgi:Putative transposase